MDVEVTIATMKLEQVATMQLGAWEGEVESVVLPCDMFWEDKQCEKRQHNPCASFAIRNR